MAKDILVEFGEFGARIHKGSDNIDFYKDSPNCVLNPDLSHVRNISPAFWVYRDNAVSHCTPEEAAQIIENEKKKAALLSAVNEIPNMEARKKIIEEIVSNMSFNEDIHILSLMVTSAKDKLSLLQGDNKLLWKYGASHEGTLSVVKREIEGLHNKLNLSFGVLAGLVCLIVYILIKVGI
jgi:hypothetical protein